MERNENHTLPASDFDGRSGRKLNMKMFKNFEKGISITDFKTKYPEDSNHILKSEGVEALKIDILNNAKEAQEQIEKGEGEVHSSVIDQGVELLKSFERVIVTDDLGEQVEYFVKGKGNLTQKIITDKNGHSRKVWVKVGEDIKTNKKHSKKKVESKIDRNKAIAAADEEGFDVSMSKIKSFEKTSEYSKDMSQEDYQDELFDYLADLERGGGDDGDEIDEHLNEAFKKIKKIVGNDVTASMDDGNVEQIRSFEFNGVEIKIGSLGDGDFVYEKDGKSKETTIDKIVKDLKKLKSKTKNNISKGDNKSDNLSKGEISESLRNGEIQKSTFKKTGSEIKKKMEMLSISLNSEIEILKSKKSEYSKSIGVDPTESLDRWDSRGLDESVASTIKIYPYQMRYYSETKGTNDSQVHSPIDFSKEGEVSTVSASSKEIAKLAQSYNEACRLIVSKLVDLTSLSTFKRNLEDKKIYSLNSNELIILGF